MVKCETIDVDVPAEAGFVIEGVIEPPYELSAEGPWPEFLRYLSIPQQKPIMKITALTHRKDAVGYAIVAGTKENYTLRLSNDVAFYKYVKDLEPNFVVDAALTPGTAVLIYFDQKSGERSIKNIVVLSSGKEQAKGKPAPSS